MVEFLPCFVFVIMVCFNAEKSSAFTKNHDHNNLAWAVDTLNAHDVASAKRIVDKKDPTTPPGFQRFSDVAAKESERSGTPRPPNPQFTYGGGYPYQPSPFKHRKSKRALQYFHHAPNEMFKL